MHYLSGLEISNFRSCTSTEFELSPFTPLVGYNNGGKSNVLSAVKWLLRRAALSETDFCNSSAQVVVGGTIEGITGEVLDRVDTRHRSRIEPLVENEQLRIRRVQPSPGGPVSKIQLWVHDPTSDPPEWKENPTGIDAAIAALFPEPIEIGAMEDAAEDAAKYKTSTTIGKLIGELVAPLESRYGSQIESSLDELRGLLEAGGSARASELEEFDEGVNAVLNDFFKGVTVSVHVPPPEVVELFKNGTIRVFENGGAAGRLISSMGHGAQRAIQMALIRYLAERRARSGAAGGTTLLLIDEPELYLHPHAVSTIRSALRTLSKSGYQVVFSTHSPQMIGVDYVADTLIIRKDRSNGTFALPTLKSAVRRTISDGRHQAETLFEFQNAAQILFADQVLIMEGKAENRLLPLIARLDSREAAEDGSLAMVSVGGASNTAKALAVLGAMGLPSKALVDLDYAFKAGRAAGLVSSDAEEIVTCQRICNELAEEGEITLGEDGFPKKGSTGSAADGFAALALAPGAGEAIASLHETLLDKDIWLWTKGTLENHLGIAGKGEGYWSEYALHLSEEGCAEVVADWASVKAFLDWAAAPHT